MIIVTGTKNSLEEKEGEETNNGKDQEDASLDESNKDDIPIPATVAEETDPPPAKEEVKPNFRNKVKLFQTTTQLQKAFAAGGSARFASRKERMESTLGINIGENLC